MGKEELFVGGIFWLTCSAYVIHYDYKRKFLNLGSIFMALLLGPIIALFVKDNIKEENVKESIRDYMNSDEHIRARGFTIPPPPPISRVGRAVSERDEAIRLGIERLDKNKIKNFKFFQK